MTLSDLEKKNYIKNYFHQYIDLTLNKNLTTTETVNLVIPFEKIINSNVNEIIDSFDDTTIEKEREVYCTKVIDGDTIWVRNVITNESNEKVLSEEEPYKVRFVGINTPERNKEGYDKVREFVTEACLYKTFYLNVDNKKEEDSYGRCLAVVILRNKNLNEILLKLEYATVMYIPPSEFTPSNWTGEAPNVSEFTSEDINLFTRFFNPDKTNIVFTSQDDYDTIYPYEIYKDVIFIKLKPFSQNIRMHFLPKSYDCNNSILLFKDNNNMIKTLTNEYVYKGNENPINSYYKDGEGIRNKITIPLNEREYDSNKWIKTFCDFSSDISSKTGGLTKLQICAGYSYNNSNPYYSIHYMGVRDNTNVQIEDRCTLIDANYDNIETNSNNVTQYHYDKNKILYIPKKERDRDIKGSYDVTDHTTDELVGDVNHKIIKYINDSLYSEEDKKYCIGNWEDLSEV